MWWKHPEIAKRWEKVTPSDKALPEHAKGKKAMSEIDDDEAVNKEKDELKKELKKLSGPDKLSKLNGFVEKRLTKLAAAKLQISAEENGDWYLYRGGVAYQENRIGGPYKSKMAAQTALENQKQKDFKDAPEGTFRA